MGTRVQAATVENDPGQQISDPVRSGLALAVAMLIVLAAPSIDPDGPVGARESGTAGAANLWEDERKRMAGVTDPQPVSPRARRCLQATEMD